jgi:hypothetical protein
MLTKEEVEEGGYTVLPKGGWIRLDPTIVPHDWEDICKDFGVDPDCEELYLCVCGVKEISFEEEEDEDE